MAALTNLLLSTNMTLSSALLLYAVGLGSSAIPMAGALNWVIKEGVGQAGTILSHTGQFLGIRRYGMFFG
jgi:hypothetical protein